MIIHAGYSPYWIKANYSGELDNLYWQGMKVKSLQGWSNGHVALYVIDRDGQLHVFTSMSKKSFLQHRAFFGGVF